MVQPISLLMAHFNVEHSAQMSRDALAAAQQTAQGQQVAQESVRRTQRVQAGMAAAEVRKVQRRSEDEEREHRRQHQDEDRDSFSSAASSEQGEEDKGRGSKEAAPQKSFDFYA